MTSLMVLFSFLAALATTTPVAKTIYEVPVNDITGKKVDMKQYQGKVLLIVNTASKCGFTPQLKDLEALYEKYKSQGFEVLAFPSNDFKQDPAENSAIQSFAQSNYQTTFPFFEKGKVVGDDKQPMYAFLTEHKSGTFFRDVNWNFEKFLVNRKGEVVERWNSTTKPSSDKIVTSIEKALASK